MHETVSFSFAVIFLFSLNRNSCSVKRRKAEKIRDFGLFFPFKLHRKFHQYSNANWLTQFRWFRSKCLHFLFLLCVFNARIMLTDFDNEFVYGAVLFVLWLLLLLIIFLWLLLKLVKINCTQNYLHGNYLLRWILLIEKLFFIIQFKDWEKRDKNKSKELTKDYTVVLNFVCVIFLFYTKKAKFLFRILFLPSKRKLGWDVIQLLLQGVWSRVNV